MKKPGILIVALWLGLGINAYPQTLSLGLSSGLFSPKDKTYRDIYGVGIPLDFEIRIRLIKHLGLAAGVSYIRDSGQAVNINQGQDSYPVQFRMVSFPISVYLLLPLKGVSLLGGVGLGVHSYEETWQTLPLSHKGNRTKPLVYAGVEFPVLRRLAVRLALRYETIKAGENPILANEVNLGGLTVVAGVSVLVF